MQIDFAGITPYNCYKLMASLIVPRPIALVTTMNDAGVVNAAPFSMFNMLGEDPPILMLSMTDGPDGRPKDTAANILAHRQFVVHLADEAIAEQMHRCGESVPPEVSEVSMVGFTTLPSSAVVPPRIAEAPVAFECELHEYLKTASRHIFIGKILMLHARDDLIDIGNFHINLKDYFPVARFGASFYIRTRERFVLAEAGAGSETFDKLA